MLTRWQSAYGSVACLLVAIVLVVLDLTVEDVRRWWSDHALTTDTVSGLLVLAFTVLVCNQVIALRQVRDRSTVIAAQAAIVVAQAFRSTQALEVLRDEPAETEAAAGEVQSYVTLLSIATPVLIDTELTRRFLEDAQQLAAALTRAVRDLSAGGVRAAREAGDGALLDAAVARLRGSSTPLMQVLSPELRAAIAPDTTT